MATNAERIEAATVSIETSSAEAEAASQVMFDFTTFDEDSDVTNQEAETFPSLLKWIKEIDAIAIGAVDIINKENAPFLIAGGQDTFTVPTTFNLSVYADGKRLNNDDFTINSPTEYTLTPALANGVEITTVAKDVNNIFAQAPTPTIQTANVQAEAENGAASFVNTFNILPQNVLVYDNFAIASITADRVKLPAGTYEVSAVAGGYRVGHQRLQIWDFTNTQELVLGLNGESGVTDETTSPVTVVGYFVLVADTEIELRHWTELANANGLGGLASDVTGKNEIFSGVVYKKLKSVPETLQDLNIILPDSTILTGFNAMIGGDLSTNPWARGTTFASPPDATYTADRWEYNKIVSTAAHTISQITGEGEGRKALRIDTGSNIALAADHETSISQKIEGYNIIHLTSGFVLSCRLRSNVAGIMCISFKNAGSDRSYVVDVDIPVPDVWQDVEVIVPVFPTIGNWDYLNGVGLKVTFAMSAGTDFQTTADAWQVGNFIATAAMLDRSAVFGRRLDIDQVQVEAGIKKSAYKPQSVKEVSEQCNRYFHNVILSARQSGGNEFRIEGAPILWPVTMRAAPTPSAMSGGTTQALAGDAIENTNIYGARYSITADSATDMQAFDREATIDAEL